MMQSVTFANSLKNAIQPYWLTLAVLLLAAYFVISSLNFFEQMPIASWGDTTTYHEMSRYSLTDPALWSGRYPMTTALFHKVCSADPPCIADVQIGLGILAWLAFGMAAILMVENRLLKLLSFAIVMGLGLTTNIIGMNKVLLSETYSNSLFMLMTAAWFLAGLYLSRHPDLPSWKQVLTTLSLFPVMFLWSFTRDPNAYYLLTVAFFLTVVVILWRKKLRPWLPAVGAFIACLVVIFAFQFYTVNRSQRSLQPFPSHIFINILPYPERVAFFADHGMPTTDAVMAMSGQFVGLDDWPTEFTEWFYEKGQRTYLLYLLSFPEVTLTAPLEHWRELLASSAFGLTKNYDAPPLQQRRFDTLFYHLSGFWLVVVVGVTAALTIFTAARRQYHWYWFIPAVMLAMTYPMMFLIWHGSPTEIPRLAVGLNLQLRLGGWLLLIFSADAMVKILQREWHMQPRPFAAKLAYALALVCIPLVLLNFAAWIPAARTNVILPLAVNLFPSRNVLSPWGVSEMQYQLFLDGVPDHVESDSILVSPSADSEGLTLVIYAENWTFRQEREVGGVNERRGLLQWRETALPNYLTALGADFVYMDAQWWRQAPDIQRTMYENPRLYELIGEWGDSSGDFRRLYRVLSGDAGIALNESTAGLTAGNFARFQDYQDASTLFPENAVIFNPATDLDWFASTAEVGNYIEALSPDEQNLMLLFDLLLTWDRMLYEDDLNLTAEQQAALDTWQNTMLPGYLKDAGIDYVFYSNLWEIYLSDEAYNILRYSGSYELVREWNENIPGSYTLLRVVGDAR